MGKKKAVKKTREASEALAEPSSIEQQTPRKRGRPRKIREKIEEEETAEECQDSAFKKGKTTEGHEEKKFEDIVEQVEGSSSKSQKEEERFEKKGLAKEKHPPRSRAKRKGKPRKSS